MSDLVEPSDMDLSYSPDSVRNYIEELEQLIKELEQELNTVHKHIKLMFPHPQVTDGLFYVPIERYNNLVDELNKQAEDL